MAPTWLSTTALCKFQGEWVQNSHEKVTFVFSYHTKKEKERKRMLALLHITDMSRFWGIHHRTGVMKTVPREEAREKKGEALSTARGRASVSDCGTHQFIVCYSGLCPLRTFSHFWSHSPLVTPIGCPLRTQNCHSIAFNATHIYWALSCIKYTHPRVAGGNQRLGQSSCVWSIYNLRKCRE